MFFFVCFGFVEPKCRCVHNFFIFNIFSNTLFHWLMKETAYATEKRKESDVYSYGVVLLELITRKQPLDPLFREDTGIASWVRSIWIKTESISQIVDSSLKEEFMDSSIMEEVNDVLLVALKCTAEQPSERPTIKDVVKQLEDAKRSVRIGIKVESKFSTAT